MRVLIALGLGTSLVFSQANMPIAQKSGDCSINIIGNSNTGTVTCDNVDKKLAEQIRQLVIASRRDGKTLKDISDKLDVLLKDLQQRPTISVTSFNQQGGITAAQVTINPPLKKLELIMERWLPVSSSLAPFKGTSLLIDVKNLTGETHAFGQSLRVALLIAGIKADVAECCILGGCSPLPGVSFQAGANRMAMANV